MPDAAIKKGTPLNLVAHARLQRSTGQRLRWRQLPEDVYLCTRHGPTWDLEGKPLPIAPNKPVPRYKGPFLLTWAAGETLRFRVQASDRDKQRVLYGTTGAPPGAKLDAKSGQFTWTPRGKPGSSYTTTLIATTSDGVKISWPMKLTIATRETARFWRLGVGRAPRDQQYAGGRGPDTPHCWHVAGIEHSFIARDLDGDGAVDLAFGVRVYSPGQVGGGSTFAYIALARPKGA